MARQDYPAYEVAIIGAGFAGIGLGIRLKLENRPDFVIFEQAAEIGGTWRDNTYPGCACDIPSFLYSYSFEPNPEWPNLFSRQPHILAYMKKCVNKYELDQHILCNMEIICATFDENSGYWTLESRDGCSFTARSVVSAIGPLNQPKIPAFKGLEKFRGRHFHSSAWPEDLELKGQTVAVIGTGASAIQIVPEIASEVEQLYVFQRTPPWIIPRRDRPIELSAQRWFQQYPRLQHFWREFIYWLLELRVFGFLGNKTMRRIQEYICKRHIRRSIDDPELRKVLTPNYDLGCKRILVSDDFYPAIALPEVELVTDGIQEITAQGIITDDRRERKIDNIIFATGFVASEFIRAISYKGRDGRDLFNEWEQTGAEAYYGLSVSGFPNLLFMVGPNTGLGHNSIIHMIESQINYIIDYFKLLEQAPLPSFLDLNPAIQRSFNQDIQSRLQKTVWATGCQSWYQTSWGKNTTLWPGSTVAYRRQTRRVNAANYMLVRPTSKASARRLL